MGERDPAETAVAEDERGAAAGAAGADAGDEELGELLLREITIDGMCGVY